MKEHDLKCWPQHYKHVVAGLKPFEVRYNDRDFQKMDRLRLREYDPIENTYSGAEITVVVTFVMTMHDAINPGYCVLAIQKLPSEAERRRNFMKLMNSDELEAAAKALSNPELANRLANEVQGNLSYIEMPWYLMEEAIQRLDPTTKNQNAPGS